MRIVEAKNGLSECFHRPLWPDESPFKSSFLNKKTFARLFLGEHHWDSQRKPWKKLTEFTSVPLCVKLLH